MINALTITNSDGGGGVFFANLISRLIEFFVDFEEYIQLDILGDYNVLTETINQKLIKTPKNVNIKLIGTKSTIKNRIPFLGMILRIVQRNVWLEQYFFDKKKFYHDYIILNMDLEAARTKKGNFEITFIHGNAPWYCPRDYPTYHLYYRIFLKKLLQRSDLVLSVSESTRSELNRLFQTPNSKIVTIHNGVDNKVFFPRNSSSSSIFLKSKYKLDNDFLLCVARIASCKNIVRIINAFLSIKEKTNVKLVIIGGISTKNSRLIRTLKDEKIKHIIHIKSVPHKDLAYFYSNAIGFVMPSLHEGFCLSLLEAMACGAPIVTSNRGSMVEAVGNCALKVDPLNTIEIAKAMYKLINNPTLREELSVLAKKRAIFFSWENSAKKLRKILESIIYFD